MNVSEVRQEAVQQALAAMQNKPKPSMPMPSKRTSVMNTSPSRERRRITDSSSDDDSILNESSSTPDHDRNSRPFSIGRSIHSSDTSSTSSPAHEMQPPPPRIIGVQEHGAQPVTQISHQNRHKTNAQQIPQPPLPPHQPQSQMLKQHHVSSRFNGTGDYDNDIPPDRPERISSRSDSGIANLADVMQNLTPSATYNAQPDVTNNAQSLRESHQGDDMIF